MIRTALLIASFAVAGMAAPPAAAQYRGMTPGWPQQAGGNFAAYYPGNYGGGPAYFVARPNYAAAGNAYAGYAPAGYAQPAYAPVTAAYANPNYAAAYGQAPSGQAAYQQAPAYAQRPVTAAYYAPPGAAYYAPAAPSYAPLNSYRVSPAGGSSAGAEAYAGYGQPTTVNYVPPRFVYRTVNAPVPVYMYRPVTVYNPVTAQPVTCLQPATTTQCQTQRKRWFSHSWFSWWRPSCGSGGCGPAPAPTTSYCTSGYCPPAPCGQQPYYPTQPGVIIPTVPAPGTISPPIFTPIPAGPTVPPQGTRFPTGSTLNPADLQPSLNVPRGSFGPPTTAPGTVIPGNPLPRTTPGTPVPTFPVDPPPAGGFGGAGTFPAGANSAPSDPYSTSRSSGIGSSGISGPTLKPPTTNVSPSLHPEIQPVPDPAAHQQTRPASRAPQLLDPRDKSAAARDERWAVVPAVWPKPEPKAAAAEPSPYRVYQERSLSTPSRPAASPNPADYDESGWTSSR